MEMVSRFLFLPLVLILLVVAMHDRLRARALALGPVAKLEKKLSGAEKLYWPAFALCMAAGVFARCWRFLELPAGYNQDGLMAAVEAYCLAQGGTDQFGMSWPTYFQAWGFAQMSTLYSWLMIPFVKLLGLSKLTLRLPMLLVSLAALPVIWDFARRLRGRNFALLALFVAAVNPWHMMQSRWALEANLLPHVMLLGAYLLLIGRKHRAALYLSMIVFGLVPYAYGLGCFSVPVVLVGMAIYYVARKKANILDVLVCVALFFAVSGPYFYTMAINAFGLETATLGPITMPLFSLSQRTHDMPFFLDNPYASMVYNLQAHFSSYLYGEEAPYNAIRWTHTMYRFMVPVLVVGFYKLWRDRRRLVALGEDSGARDGGMLVLCWYAAAVINGMCIGAVANRNNVVFYPLILLCAYGLYAMGKRMRTATALVMAMMLVGFVGLNVTYFTDEAYQKQVADTFHDGLVEAVIDTWDWDYDEYVVSVEGSKTSRLRAEAAVMFAHQIDYSGRSEQVDLRNAHGESTGWYYTERYQFVNMAEYEPDPMACSVYIIHQSEKQYFSEDEYMITEYGNFAAAYPRYWAE